MAITKKRWDATEDRAGLIAGAVRKRMAKAFAAVPALAGRFDRHFGDFWRAYTALYGEAYAVVAPTLALFDTLAAHATARPADARARDAAREAKPDWHQEPTLVGISLYVDRFAGTLRGLIGRIPYLKELGITYVHLMPVLKPREGANDGGFAVADFKTVDPRLGTIDDLRALADALHAEGMHLVIDLVMNHTAKEHEWAQAALTGDADAQSLYMMYDDRRVPDAFEATLPEVFPDFAPGNFTFYPEIEKWVWTSFYDFQWDLNYANPEVFRRIFDVIAYLTNVGADVLRMDAVPFTWKTLGTNCRNLPGAHEILRAFRALVHIAAPGLAFKAEAIVAPDDIVRYLGVGGFEGKECDMAYNATLMCHLWHALASENTQLLRTALTALPPTPDGATWLNYIRCHDDIGWGLDDADAAAIGQNGYRTRLFCSDFYAGRLPQSFSEGYRFQIDPHTGEARTSGTAAALAGLQKAQVEGLPSEIDRAVRRLLMLHSIVFTMRGAPLLFSGDEVGQLNDFTYLDEPGKSIDNRWVHRPAMDWGRAEARHTPGTIAHRLFHALRRFAEARKGLRALHGQAEEHVFFTRNDQVFVVERAYEGERLLVVSNFSGKPQRVPLAELPPRWQGTVFRDVLGGRPVRFSFGEIVLEPYGFWWLAPAEADARGPAEATKIAETVIRVRGETDFGEALYLVGNLPALGGDDPRHALGPLDPADYPHWSLRIAAPADTFFRFRWLKKRDRHLVAWSSTGYWMKSGDSRIFEL